jgi:tripartite-type tricarboxylate transporter receptor subunit TctC
VKSSFLNSAFIVLLSAAAVLCTPSAGAQNYPARPIRLVVSAGPATAIDLIARAIAQFASPNLGQPIVVENRPGASGDIATTAVARSEPDGYTILITSTSEFVLELTGQSKSKVQKDFQLVSVAGRAPWVFAVSSNSPFHSIKEVVDFARANPSKLSYTSIGGGIPQFLGETLAKSEGISIVAVPYKSTTDAMLDVLDQRVAVWFTALASSMALHKSGKIRILGTSGDVHDESMKDVPTMKEAGFSALDLESVYFVLAPIGTPKPIIERLNMEISKAEKDQSIKQKLISLGVFPLSGTVDESQLILTQEFKEWADIVASSKQP